MTTAKSQNQDDGARESNLSIEQFDGLWKGKTFSWTQAQQEEFWRQWEGTIFVWLGEVMDVTTDSGGRLMLLCRFPRAPRGQPDERRLAEFARIPDTVVQVENSQLNVLSSLQKKQIVTFRGKLTGVTKEITPRAELIGDPDGNYLFADGRILNVDDRVPEAVAPVPSP